MSLAAAGAPSARRWHRSWDILIIDKELVRQDAVETGFDEKYMNRLASMPPPKTGSLLVLLPGSREPWRECPPMIFFGPIQCRVIRSLAEKEPCVIVGRCADYILREQEDCLNVFSRLYGGPGGPYRAPVRLQREEPRKTPGGEGQEAPASTTSTIPTGIGACPELPPLSGQRNHRHPAVRGHHLRAGKDTVKNCGGS